MSKKLYRSRNERIIGGVCGGLGEYLNIDPVWIRLGFVLLLMTTQAFAFWVYIIMWVIIPPEERLSGSTTTSSPIQDNVQEIADRARELGRDIQRGIQGNRSVSEGEDTSGPILIAVLCILLGVVLLMGRFRAFWWFSFGKMWPLLLVLLGGALLYSRIKE
jgi:phage shock protein C